VKPLPDLLKHGASVYENASLCVRSFYLRGLYKIFLKMIRILKSNDKPFWKCLWDMINLNIVIKYMG